jgi:formate hydrogenlyase transcriptional activator
MTQVAQPRQCPVRHSAGRRIGFRSYRAEKFSTREGHSMSIAGFAITPELPPVSVLPQLPLRLPGDHSETMSGDADRLTAELNTNRVSWKEEDGTEQVFEGMLGTSAALKSMLRQVEVVAPTDSGVLILGETGTGKELIGRAIHNLSARRGRPFVKVNCAAIPSGLLESELFGHEKGAFTGAVMRKAGRFEIADKGTLFLDEVGDIPLELQPKLLRVLQEHEFERLGSTRTQQVDVRVVAATHRNLKQMVENGEFRSDLYYRLHVFPLPVPPLRNRREDIPVLVRHFVDDYARRMNRHIETVSPQAMEALTSYSWPGNVRELQNFIERAVILSPGTSLRAPLDELTQETVQRSQTQLSTLEEMERDHVLRALKESNWVTGGPKGAAAKLGMKRTTLAYRIRKLGIPVRPQL